MNDVYLKEEFILNNYKCEKFEDVIYALCQRLVEGKAIEKEYFDAVIEREKKFPTGLPTEPYKVAIPHASGDGLVLKSSLAVAVLNKPVNVIEAGSSVGKNLKVDIVFLIAMKSADGQLDMLRRLNEIFTKKEYLEKIKNSETPKEVINILQNVE
ncbi:MAG TPA: PTS sugar transporter subunit IIA [Eubacteriaceae bacterium]|jgi:PTS system galactitol-specific IIA component|nr:PTS sugar transporter subunit IIA [Eubacteriaceae bacterium]